jgi:hypothetical protein
MIIENPINWLTLLTAHCVLNARIMVLPCPRIMMISIFDMSTFKFDNGGFVMSIQPRTGLQIAKKSWFAWDNEGGVDIFSID